MAEVAILGLLKKLPFSTLMKQLGSLAIEEVKYLSELKTELLSLDSELRLISPYLKEADAKSHRSELTKEWVRQLRVLAFQAEDVIDSFVYKMGKKVFRKPKSAHKLRKKIEVINQGLRRLFEDRENLGIETLEEGETSAAQARRLAALDDVDYRPLDVDVVGFQSKAEALTILLISNNHLRPFRVFSIIGATGVGKTTLANKIYGRNDVQKHFVCAFVYKTTKKEVKDVLIEIMVQVMLVNEAEIEDYASKDISNLKATLSNFLKEETKKNYLFVLDDVQSARDWEILKDILPFICDRQRLTVLLTTCDENVGLRADPTPEQNYKLNPLDERNSELLFSKVFFRAQDDEVARRSFDHLNQDMNGVPKRMVSRCEGLPQTILQLGSLLLGKKGRLTTPAEWQKVHDGLDWDPEWSDDEKAFAMCAASYFELSYLLKMCFLYFGFFPARAIEIPRDRLIRLWMAEGFMVPQHELRMEQEEGREWLETLVQKNLIEVVKRKSNGVPESFIIRDFFLKFVVTRAKEGNFLNIPTFTDSLQGHRRVAIHHRCTEDSVAGASPSSSSTFQLRSLLSFDEMSPSLCGQFNLLNVLDLEGAPGIKKFPKEIRKLILLKYLSLCGTDLEEIPRWVRELWNLQTLNLYKTNIKFVPIEVFELEKLRHLLCFNSELRKSNDFIVKSALNIRGRGYPARRILRLRDLQTLWFHASSWIEDDFGALTNLRELGLIGLAGVMEKFREALHKALGKLKRLETLYLEEQEQDSPKKGKEKQKKKEEQGQQSSLEDGTILPPFSDHEYLQDITFIGGGGIRQLPLLKDFPLSLSRLRLANILLKQDMMATLQLLPHLRDLILDRHSYDGVAMICSAGGFSKLENLTLIWFEKLRFWKVEKGAMPNLRTLEINSLFALKCIPMGLKHITKLQKLSLSMPRAFLERVKEGGDDWENIKHVPSMKDRKSRSQNITEVQTPPQVSQHLNETDSNLRDELRSKLRREYDADQPENISGPSTSTSH